jgi:hypothetical protein
MIKVTKEPKDGDIFDGPPEQCWFCDTATRYWANEGEVPVCRECAKTRDPKEVPTRDVYVGTWGRKKRPKPWPDGADHDHEETCLVIAKGAAKWCKRCGAIKEGPSDRWFYPDRGDL